MSKVLSPICNLYYFELIGKYRPYFKCEKTFRGLIEDYKNRNVNHSLVKDFLKKYLQ